MFIYQLKAKKEIVWQLFDLDEKRRKAGKWGFLPLRYF